MDILASLVIPRDVRIIFNFRYRMPVSKIAQKVEEREIVPIIDHAVTNWYYSQ